MPQKEESNMNDNYEIQTKSENNRGNISEEQNSKFKRKGRNQ